jgi:hypothetical protein
MSEETTNVHQETPKAEKTKPNKIDWSAEKVMSISALFVSAISLFALFYQLNLAREENELIRKEQKASVLPHLSQWFSNTSEYFQITFGNRGVGPAFIKEVQIVINDSLHFSNTDDAIAHIFKTTPELDSIPFSTSTFKKGYVLPANQTINIVRLKNGKASVYFQQYMANNSLDYEVIYEDVYGTRWSLSSEKDENIPVLLNTEND